MSILISFSEVSRERFGTMLRIRLCRILLRFQRLLFLAALVSCPFTVQASDYLEPEISAFHGPGTKSYAETLVLLFSEAFNRNVGARVIVVSLMAGAEYVVGIKDDLDTPKIFKLWPENFLHRQVNIDKFRTILKNDPGAVKLGRCEIEIDTALADRIVKIWTFMLSNTRHTLENRMGFDGSMYHFSMDIHRQTLTGHVWSPDGKSNTGQLVQIAHTMAQQCTDKSGHLSAELDRQTRALLDRLLHRKN